MVQFNLKLHNLATSPLKNIILKIPKNISNENATSTHLQRIFIFIKLFPLQHYRTFFSFSPQQEYMSFLVVYRAFVCDCMCENACARIFVCVRIFFPRQLGKRVHEDTSLRLLSFFRAFPPVRSCICELSFISWSSLCVFVCVRNFPYISLFPLLFSVLCTFSLSHITEQYFQQLTCCLIVVHLFGLHMDLLWKIFF